MAADIPVSRNNCRRNMTALQWFDPPMILHPASKSKALKEAALGIGVKGGL